MKARHTLNFVTVALFRFPKSIGLFGAEQKRNFPDHANLPENRGKIILFSDPDKCTFDSKSAKDEQKLLEWYNTEKPACNFWKQMTLNCSNDVMVLRKSAFKFRGDFIALTDIDFFQSVTMATACHKVFRTFMLKKEEIAVIPAHGYQSNRQTSLEASQWLEWKNMSANSRIVYDRNGREKRI